MADPLEGLKQTVVDAIDAFVDHRIGQMQAYLHGENNVHNLQNAVNALTVMNNAITDLDLVAGEVAVEVMNEEELEEVKDLARHSVHLTRNRIPRLVNYINGENNLHNLQNTIENLIFIRNQITNPALFAPPPGH